MKNILIAGGTGFVGKRLTQLLIENGYSVSILTRNLKSNTKNITYYKWNINENYIDEKAILNANAIINLSGENIASLRWTKERKKLILESRITSIRLIYSVLKKYNKKLEVFVSASAIGIYGNDFSDDVYVEESNKGVDFLADVCVKWEKEAEMISVLKNRTVIIRTGLVIGNEGFLEKIKTLFKFRLGAVLGSGKQYMSWIDLNDLCNMYLFSIENKRVEGIYNAVINDGVTNLIFSKTLAKIFKNTIWLPNIPSFIIKLIYGEMSSLILNGKRVSSEKIQALGFKFKNEKLDKSLNDYITK